MGHAGHSDPHAGGDIDKVPRDGAGLVSNIVNRPEKK
jgi:hypothetical protein